MQNQPEDQSQTQPQDQGEEVKVEVIVPVADAQKFTSQEAFIAYCAYQIWLVAVHGGFIPQDKQIEGRWPEGMLVDMQINTIWKDGTVDETPEDGLPPVPIQHFQVVSSFTAKRVNDGLVALNLADALSMDHTQTHDAFDPNGFAFASPAEFNALIGALMNESGLCFTESVPRARLLADAASAISTLTYSSACIMASLCILMGLLTPEHMAATSDKSVEEIEAEHAHILEGAHRFAQGCLENYAKSKASQN